MALARVRPRVQRVLPALHLRLDRHQARRLREFVRQPPPVCLGNHDSFETLFSLFSLFSLLSLFSREAQCCRVARI
jgi:hypothetical protein